MLILTRKIGEAIAIGDDVRIQVIDVKGRQVRLGIEAPPETEVHREEVYNRIQDQNRQAAGLTPDDLSAVSIRTTRFGVIDVDPQTIITITGGLIGFPRDEQYVVVRHSEQSPFFWLQAVDSPDLAFVIVDPKVFKPDYKVTYPKSLFRSLGADGPSDLSVFVIVTIPPGQPQAMTANLLGPVVVNTKARLARQLVLDEKVYDHRHPIVSQT